MKPIDQEQDTVASFSSSSSSSSSTAADRSDGVLECWSTGVLGYSATDHFRGLSLELFARSVMNSDTVLPKAVKTAGLNNAPIEWGLRQRRLAATISLERRVVSKQ
jgi:hypothetical protein